MARGKMSKPIAFRPTEKTVEAIDVLLKNKEAKDRTEAVNKLIEKGLEHPRTEGEEPTGIILHCPLRLLPYPLEEPISLWKVPVDSSVCKTCHKHPCSSWEEQKSWERINPKSMIKTTP